MAWSMTDREASASRSWSDSRIWRVWRLTRVSTPQAWAANSVARRRALSWKAFGTVAYRFSAPRVPSSVVSGSDRELRDPVAQGVGGIAVPALLSGQVRDADRPPCPQRLQAGSVADGVLLLVDVRRQRAAVGHGERLFAFGQRDAAVGRRADHAGGQAGDLVQQVLEVGGGQQQPGQFGEGLG